MLLVIDEDALRAELYKRKEFIGFGPLGNSLLTAISGGFYILTAVGIESLWKWPFLCFGGFTLGYGVVQLGLHRFTAQSLYKEIVSMNIKSSSIVAIRRPDAEPSNQYLLYWDEGWGCWFFPNCKSADTYPESLERVQNYLATNFGIQADANDLGVVAQYENSKLSTEHNEMRQYHYTLFLDKLTQIPAAWGNADEFEIGTLKCRWMTTQEMLADPTIREINSDVVTLVRDMAA